MTEFEALRGAANWAELSAGLEKYLSGSGVFWLDGQRLAHQALLGQGPGHAAAAREVARGLGLLLGRLPGLVELAFEDGTPFADATTRAWIQREVLAAPGGGGAGGGGAAEPWSAGLETARGLVGEGQAEAAVALLASGAAAAGSGRARLRWRIALGRLLLESGKAAVALPVAQAAMEAARPMTDWEPEATTEAARLLADCLGAKEAATLLDGAALAEARRRIAAEMALLDPVRAMRAGAAESV
jgi:type VI secretion system protein VasJ